MRASKTAAKHAAQDAQQLGKELLEVPADVLAGFGLEPELLEALAQCRRHKGHKEFRRLMQHVGALMRAVDGAAVAAHLQQWRDVTGREPARLEQVRRWRDALVDGDAGVLDEILAVAPTLDRARVEKLAANAQWERAQQRPPRDFRALFALIRDATVMQAATPDESKPGP